MALTASEAMTFAASPAAWRAPRTASGSSARSLDVNATSAEASAASVPAAPIATPTESGRQGGRVVDAVTDHRDRPALGVEFLVGAQLVLGQHPRAALSGADPRARRWPRPARSRL